MHNLVITRCWSADEEKQLAWVDIAIETVFVASTLHSNTANKTLDRSIRKLFKLFDKTKNSWTSFLSCTLSELNAGVGVLEMHMYG